MQNFHTICDQYSTNASTNWTDKYKTLIINCVNNFMQTEIALIGAKVPVLDARIGKLS
jgi:hypothetical protein